MKKLTLFLSLLMIAGSVMAHDGKGGCCKDKKHCSKKEACCKDKKHCGKDCKDKKESKDEKKS
jgi:hypothetical protein